MRGPNTCSLVDQNEYISNSNIIYPCVFFSLSIYDHKFWYIKMGQASLPFFLALPFSNDRASLLRKGSFRAAAKWRFEHFLCVSAVFMSFLTSPAYSTTATLHYFKVGLSVNAVWGVFCTCFQQFFCQSVGHSSMWKGWVSICIPFAKQPVRWGPFITKAVECYAERCDLHYCRSSEL